MPDGGANQEPKDGQRVTTNPFQLWLDAFKPDARMSELAEASTQMMGAWSKAWQAALSGRVAPAMELMNPLAWGEGGRDVADLLETVLGTPTWSDLPSLDGDTLRSFAPAVELIQIGQAYSAAVAQVCLDVCTTFQSRIAEKGLKLDGSGEAMDLWNNVVDERLMAFNRSDTFAELQRRFVRALMAFKREQRWAAGRLAEQVQLPTREEVDELARRVHDLERETRRLRRAVAAQPQTQRSEP